MSDTHDSSFFARLLLNELLQVYQQLINDDAPDTEE